MAENTTNETRFVGNVTKSTTGATLFAGSILTIVNYGLAQAGITIPAEVQTAAVTVILGLVVLITGRNTRGEKAHLEGAMRAKVDALVARPAAQPTQVNIQADDLRGIIREELSNIRLKGETA